MKRLGRSIIPIVFLSLFAQGTVFATPSTTYWTVSTSDVQPFEKLNPKVEADGLFQGTHY